MASATAPLEPTALLPQVRLEVRQGGRSVPYRFDHVDFLVGSVAGCDLRVPGETPGVLCLLSRSPAGLSLRKLAPTQMLLLNGKNASSTTLADGDRITLGAIDLFVHIDAVANAEVEPAPAPIDREAEASLAQAQADFQQKIIAFKNQVLAFQQMRDAFEAERTEHARRLDAVVRREDAARDDVPALEAERDEWRLKYESLAAELAARPVVVPVNDAALSRRDQELRERDEILAARHAEIERQKQEIAAVRQELADIRRQMYDRYQERRDKLASLQESVEKAAKKVQERKRLLDAEAAEMHRQREAEAGRQAEMERRTQELTALVQKLEAERKSLQQSRAEVQADLEGQVSEVREREERLAQERREMEARLKQYQSDLVRLDRRQGDVELREAEIATKLDEVEKRHRQMEWDSSELERQAVELDEMRSKAIEETQRLAQQKQEQDLIAAQLAQRAASLEGQQATLAALRSRMERIREEFRREEQYLAEQRTRQEANEADLEQQTQALLSLRQDLDNEQKLREMERQQMTERSATLDAAVHRLKTAQEQFAQQEELVRTQLAEVEAKTAIIAEQEAMLQSRLTQVGEAQERLEAERMSIRERTVALAQAEQAREALQEQLRRRSEDLAAKQKTLNDQIQEYQGKLAGLDAIQAERDRQNLETQSALAQQRQEIETQLEEVSRRQGQLIEQDQLLAKQHEEMQEMGRRIAEQHKVLAEQQEQNRLEWQRRQEAEAKLRAEFDEMHRDAQDILRQLPDLELRAGSALDRLASARDEMRDHVAEIHTYVRQCQDDLETVRGRLESESGRLEDREQSLRLSQDEHRLGMVAFRQHLLEWQNQIGEIKRMLAQNQALLERKQAEVAEQARSTEAAHAAVMRQADRLAAQSEDATQRRDELDRQLVDMREWYRRKMRELAGIPADWQAPARRELPPAPIENDAEDSIAPNQRDILSLTEPVHPSDELLGQHLQDNNLVDFDTLQALMVEARRQRRSLRQVLLASGVVTPFQLGLIESGNVDGLMLGSLRLIDRLRSTAHETVYRVFDPARGIEAVLRHLSAEDMHDAVHPDEFRQRFQNVMLQEPQVAGTIEVLDLDGRPAVLQEWLTGLSAADWPPLAAAPGVCFRLLTQAALGLHALHRAGITHGRLSDRHLLLTGDGMLKILGAGEPGWLVDAAEVASDSRQDLRTLGHLVAGWCTNAGVRKGAKARPLPDAMVAVLAKMEADDGYATAQDLLDDLDRVGADVPPNAEAWDRLLKYVREHGAPEALQRRQSA